MEGSGLKNVLTFYMMSKEEEVVLMISYGGGGGGGGVMFSGTTQSKTRLKFVYSNRPINTWSRLWTEKTREVSTLSQAILFPTS